MLPRLPGKGSRVNLGYMYVAGFFSKLLITILLNVNKLGIVYLSVQLIQGSMVKIIVGTSAS
jgi:hypothetical protein